MRNIFLIACLITAIACNNTDERITNIQIENRTQIHRTIAANTDFQLYELEKKVQEPMSHEKGKIWFPKAEKVKEFSQRALSVLDKDQASIIADQDRFIQTIGELNTIRDSILSVDQLIKQEFGPRFYLINGHFDSLIGLKKYRSFSKTRSDREKIFHIMHSNLLINTYKIVSFCNEQISVHRPFYFDELLVSQNKSIFKPGEEIQITTGIGYFKATKENIITVGNKKYRLTDYGYIAANLIAPSKPGIYFIPIKASYVDEFGLKQNFKAMIKYRVEE